MSNTVAIVGASHAGVQVAAALRQGGWQEPILLLSAEGSLPYQRPPLSKAFLCGKCTDEQILLRGENFYANQGIDLRLNTVVDAIAQANHRIFVGNYGIDYSKLILATGASARRATFSGHGLRGVHVLRSIADARQLKINFDHADHLVIIGGGFIGLEVAASAVNADKQVTVIEAQDRLLARAVPPYLSDYLLDYHRHMGVDIRLSTSVERFEGAGGRVSGVRLASGEILDTGLVVVGIGSFANCGLALTAALAIESGGIRVDRAGRTSVADVYAIGDCASQLNSFTGTVTRVESVQNASDQARTVAAHLTGQPAPAPFANWFWTDQYDLKIQIAGIMDADCKALLRGDPESGSFSLVQIRDGRLLSTFSVNRPVDHIAARKLIAARTSLDPRLACDSETPLVKATRDPL